MQAYMEALYSFAQENEVLKYLRTSEYDEATGGLEGRWNRFRDILTEEQRQTLSELYAREMAISFLENKAAFSAGMSIGLDLGKLGTKDEAS